MKRVITILFTVLYFTTSSGILFGQHLCMGRVSDSALFKKVENKCGMSSDMHQEMEDCCDDEWSLEVIEDFQQISSIQETPASQYFLLFEIDFSLLDLENEECGKNLVVTNNGPPDLSKPDLYLFFQSLKIPSDLAS